MEGNHQAECITRDCAHTRDDACMAEEGCHAHKADQTDHPELGIWGGEGGPVDSAKAETEVKR